MIWMLEYDNKKPQGYLLWCLGKDKQWVWLLGGNVPVRVPNSLIEARLAWTRSKEYLSDKYADSKLKAVKAREA